MKPKISLVIIILISLLVGLAIANSKPTDLNKNVCKKGICTPDVQTASSKPKASAKTNVMTDLSKLAYNHNTATPVAQAELPRTGVGNLLGLFILISLLGYGFMSLSTFRAITAKSPKSPS